MPLDFIPQKSKKRNKSQFKNIGWDLAIFLHIQGWKGQEGLQVYMGDQQIEGNDSSFVTTKGTFKFQKFGIRV